MYKLIYCCCCLLLIVTTQLSAKLMRVEELTNGWSLREKGSDTFISVPKIPSGVYTALEKTYGDLQAPGNDINLRWIANRTWIYNITFDLPDELSVDSLVNLTLHGIDTVAKIWLNGELLGSTDNMFVRYSFVVGHVLQSNGPNLLEIELLSPLEQANALAEQSLQLGNPPSCPASRGDVECHRNMLRKMQMSFGGAWHPAALSLGIWKPVTIEYYTVAILRNVDVALKRNSTHWTMDCRAFVDTADAEQFHAQLVVYASELLPEPVEFEPQLLSYSSAMLEFQLHIPKDNVELWWPNGYGAQILYPVLFSLKCYRGEEQPSLMSRTESKQLLNIGFRTIELVEDEDAYGRSFYFRVNDQPIFMKGVNYVPADILPELAADTDTLQYLLQAAKDAHMNMIRVWGGGLYESDAFYDLTDAYGLLVWQDMTYVKAVYPVDDVHMTSMRLEAAQNAQRIGYRASLALMVTNSEIELYLAENHTDFGTEAARLAAEYKMLFIDNISEELNILAKPRAGPMLSTPSLGIAESGDKLAQNPQDPKYGDVHFYDEDMLPAVWNIYPEARFVSSFGYASLPMRSAWLHVLGKDATEKRLVELINQRQHNPEGFVAMLQLMEKQLPPLLSWEKHIDKFVYFSQVSQALTTKLAVELFRSRRSQHRTMGALIWQLNDVWLAPTASCIDFYGNYKLVYYWARDFLAPIGIMAIYNEANDQINITITREDYVSNGDMQVYDVIINTYLWNDIFVKKQIARAVPLGANSMDFLKIPMESVLYEKHSKHEIFLELLLKDKEEEIVARNYFYPVPIKDIVGMRDPKLQLDVIGLDCSNRVAPFENNFSLRITVHSPALFVYVELNHPEYMNFTHSFSMNGFTQTVPRQIVHLEFVNNSECLTLNASHFSVRTMNQYIK
ncbi:beta-mannosidase-like [Drosophila busckii]|uniref:beta-mannosidase-like n=1 Tax=Drosophila busckii TaxID=30019 RepID=UPI00083EC6F2|nr:beta-mannosidase-like [Drosophila busckii]